MGRIQANAANKWEESIEETYGRTIEDGEDKKTVVGSYTSLLLCIVKTPGDAEYSQAAGHMVDATLVMLAEKRCL